MRRPLPASSTPCGLSTFFFFLPPFFSSIQCSPWLVARISRMKTQRKHNRTHAQSRTHAVGVDGWLGREGKKIRARRCDYLKASKRDEQLLSTSHFPLDCAPLPLTPTPPMIGLLQPFSSPPPTSTQFLNSRLYWLGL